MKPAKEKLTDEASVQLYMSQLEHPLKAEIETLRTIIKNTDNKISERIKWNAPSYYYRKDMVTFNHRDIKRVCLVFHHASIVKIQSDLLQGDYKDRRIVYFNDMSDIKANQQELERIIHELLEHVEHEN